MPGDRDIHLRGQSLGGPHVTNSYVTYIFLLYYIPETGLEPPTQDTRASRQTDPRSPVLLSTGETQSQ